MAVLGIGSDGKQHVLIWNPTTGAVSDRGQGAPGGINADGTVVGQTLDGTAAYWRPDGALHSLGFRGQLSRVNVFGQAVGFRIGSTGPVPLMVDLRHGSRLTLLKLPSGALSGIAKDISDSGLIVGDVFTDPAGLNSQGALWTSPSKPSLLSRLAGGRALNGLKVADASGVNDNGLIAGSVTPALRGRSSPSQYREDAMYLEVIRPWMKLSNLAWWFEDAGSHLKKDFRSYDLGQLANRLAKVVDHARVLDYDGHRQAACSLMSGVEAIVLHRFFKGDPDKEQIGWDLYWSIWDWRFERGC